MNIGEKQDVIVIEPVEEPDMPDVPEVVPEPEKGPAGDFAHDHCDCGCGAHVGCFIWE